MERGQCGLKQASMSRSFPYACLSLGISRPPAVKMRPRTLTCIDLDSVCPMLTTLFIYLLFSQGTGVFFYYYNVFNMSLNHVCTLCRE